MTNKTGEKHMKLRDLKEWLDTKSEDDLDKDFGVAYHIFPERENISHPVRIGYYGTEGFNGYLLMCMTDREMELCNQIDELKKQSKENSVY